MINEVLEVQDYINGININKKCLYRICYMLAKWYKQQSMTHIEIRQAIFEWGKKYNVYISCNLNNIIYQALKDKQRLRDNVSIKINEFDVNEIKRRFDNKNCRMVALAILCIAKCSANRDGEFNISILALSNWLHINHGNISSRYITELIDFGYISKVNFEKTFAWNKQVKSKSLNIKLEVPINNSGEVFLVDNNIIDLYNSIFK